MTAAKAIEYRIIQQLLSRPDELDGPRTSRAGRRCTGRVGRRRISRVGGRNIVPLLERASAVLAATAAVFVLGAVLQELLWVLMAAVTIFVLGADEG